MIKLALKYSFLNEQMLILLSGYDQLIMTDCEVIKKINIFQEHYSTGPMPWGEMGKCVYSSETKKI